MPPKAPTPETTPPPPATEQPEGLGTRIARRFAGIGPTEPLEEFPRQIARPAEFPDDPD